MIYAVTIAALLAVVLAAVAVAIYLMKRWGLFVPAYVQAVQAVQQNERAEQKLLTDGARKFSQHVCVQIGALQASAEQKRALYVFVMDADGKMMQAMQNDGLQVALTGVRFGAMTVTFRLKLREFSRANLSKLMKMGDVLAQSVGVKNARMISGPGFVDCEITSPHRLPIDLNSLAKVTRDTVVALGVDCDRKPVTVDISQHGLIAAIAPSRRGKTQAIRTMLYLLKRANPDYNIVVVAFKTADWQAFSGDAVLILDSEEIRQFQAWLLETMYARAKRPQSDRWIVVFDDLINLLALNPELQETVKQCASLGAGTGITTIASTQYSGKSSGGTDVFANATCRLLFKPSSNQQGARDGGMAGLELDQLSDRKGDALLVVDGESTRISTALVDDNRIANLDTGAPAREWIQAKRTGSLPTSFAMHPMEQLIEKLNGWLTDTGTFDWEEGKFNNRSEALRRLGWSRNGHYNSKLMELENYIFEQSERYA